MLTLRRSDLLSYAERDALLFHTLRGREVADFLERDGAHHREEGAAQMSSPIAPKAYVIFPTALTSPCFSIAASQRTFSGYSSMRRSMLQARDMLIWTARALRIVPRSSHDAFADAVTSFGELEAEEWSDQTFGDASALPRLRKVIFSVVDSSLALFNLARDAGSSDDTIAEQAARVADAVDNLVARLRDGPSRRVDGSRPATTEGGTAPSLPVLKRAATSFRRHILEYITMRRQKLCTKLCDALDLEALRKRDRSVRTARTLSSATGLVLGALHRALNTDAPGSEPRSEEAKRQLLFFANSLHNRRLAPPPPVHQMKTWSAMTPCVRPAQT